MRKFWNWVKNSDDSRTLYLDGVIADETWWGDEITPRAFKDELMSGDGDVTVWINSPGGDVFAAAQIYNMLKEYGGRVTVKIDGIAASAASVVAMAGGEVLMSPVSVMMIHNPATVAIGDGEEMLRAKALLDEIKESIINAYEMKTNLSRARISHLMDQESWMNANKAVELGFADGIIYADNGNETATEPESAWNRARAVGGGGMLFSRQAVMNSILRKLPHGESSRGETPESTVSPTVTPKGTPIESLGWSDAPRPARLCDLDKRLSLLSH